MRIIAGRWRGRPLAAPAGPGTRPTAERLRQALFDMLSHAPWAGRALLDGALVLDLFAGTGALGLVALSRGAAQAEFFETSRPALSCLRANIATLGAAEQTRVHALDASCPPRGPCARLVFLDPPYGQELIPAALRGLAAAARIDAASLIIAELARDEPLPPLLRVRAERSHGAGRMVIGSFQPNS